MQRFRKNRFWRRSKKWRLGILVFSASDPKYNPALFKEALIALIREDIFQQKCAELEG